MQTGKKKLVLDHLIVQNMDDENGSKEDVQSILMFGAKALFEDNEETAAREVNCKRTLFFAKTLRLIITADSEHDIANLVEKTEKEGDQVEPDSGGAGSLFAFAKVWSADKEGLEELAEGLPEPAEEADSWSKALELIAARKAVEKAKELTGRGVRRKAAAVFPQVCEIHYSLTMELNSKTLSQNISNKISTLAIVRSRTRANVRGRNRNQRADLLDPMIPTSTCQCPILPPIPTSQRMSPWMRTTLHFDPCQMTALARHLLKNCPRNSLVARAISNVVPTSSHHPSRTGSRRPMRRWNFVDYAASITYPGNVR